MTRIELITIFVLVINKVSKKYQKMTRIINPHFFQASKFTFDEKVVNATIQNDFNDLIRIIEGRLHEENLIEWVSAMTVSVVDDLEKIEDGLWVEIDDKMVCYSQLNLGRMSVVYIFVDGYDYNSVNIGIAERLVNDPSYQWPN